MTESSFNNFSSDGQQADRLTHAPLFAGINGFGVAADWMGWDQPFHCEIDPFCQKIIQYYWPNSKPYYDIRETDFTIWRNKIDILTGGFPCQPYSSAGKRLGTEDDRHLWPEMLRAIREIKPRFIVGENVSGILSWNEGLVFNEVQADLEAEGYKVQPCVLPACAINAPHRRDRVWFVAYSNECSKGSSRTSRETESNGSKNNDEQSSRRKQAEQHSGCSDVLRTTPNPNDILHQGELDNGGNREEAKGSEGCYQQQRSSSYGERIWTEPSSSSKDATNTERKRQQEQGQPGRPMHQETDREWKASWSYDDGRWPTQPPICSGDDGISKQLDGITFPKWRQESIKAYGNAIVPQVVYQIFKSLMIAESKGREGKIIKTDRMHEPMSKTGT